MPDLHINIGKLKLRNPVMAASGTFGYAEEFADFMDLRQLGAVVTKTITLKPRQGNPPPRTCETPAGMLNSIGLENPGIEVFLKEKLPLLKKIGIPVIVSIASEGGQGEFVELARRLAKIREVAAVELNISCPNIRGKPLLISQNAKSTYELTMAVRRVIKKTLIVKLSPNVTDIAEIAQAAQAGGSDAVSLINTLVGMSIDTEKFQPKLAAVTGGLSGPAIRPIAVRIVWEVYKKIKIPIIGMGGIINTSDAVEFFLAGATAVSVGTANFINPRATIEIIQGLKDYLAKNKFKSIRQVIGKLKT
jgi:dihydroorotate dehydrogenase (NAD+) catalytic subunit